MATVAASPNVEIGSVPVHLYSICMTQLLQLQRMRYNGSPIFKVVPEFLKGVMNLFLFIYMYVISCRKFAKNTQILKTADFAL